MKRLLLLLILISMPLVSQTKWFTTYYPTWCMRPTVDASYSCPPWEINMTGMSHIILFDNGNITKTSPYWAYMFNSVPSDAETDSLTIEYNGHNVGTSIKYIDTLVNRAHASGVRVLVTIQAVYTTLPCLNYIASDSIRTQTLVNTAVAWAERKHLDGFELDWEGWSGPGLPPRDSMAAFVRILYRRVHTMTTGLGGTGQLIASAGINDYDKYPVGQDYMVDQFDLQTYAYGSAWFGRDSSNVAWHIAPLYRQSWLPADFDGQAVSTRGPLQWIAAGHDRSHLGVGLPTFGHIIPGVDGFFQTYSQGLIEKNYQELRAYASNGGTTVWNDTMKCEYIKGTAVSATGDVAAGQKFMASYLSPRAMREMISFVKANSLGGIMTYNVFADMDATKAKTDSLRNPIQSVIVKELNSGYVAQTTLKRTLKLRKR